MSTTIILILLGVFLTAATLQIFTLRKVSKEANEVKSNTNNNK